MRSWIPAPGVLLLAAAAGIAACAGEPETAPAAEAPPAIAAAEAGAAPETARAAPAAEPVSQSEGVVAYDSATHGALQVNGVSATPTDTFDVLAGGERALDGDPKLLGEAVELPPGSYVVDVNRTRREVTIAAGKKTILWTGELAVEGGPETAVWYPMSEGERRLAGDPPLLGTGRSLFPGSYAVLVDTGAEAADRDLGTAEVMAGRRTVLRHGPP